MAVIRYVAGSFSVAVPSHWVRMATPAHLVVFLDPASEMTGGSITISRHGMSASEAAEAAAIDHRTRFSLYEVIHESSRPLAVYRRFRWRREDASGIVQHQLFVEDMVLTCSREEDQVTVDGILERAIRSFRIRPGALGRADPGD